MRLRYVTAGESHGPALVGILEGMPAGVPVSSERIDRDLRRRQGGYGRGGRMKIEQDHAEMLSGVRFGLTLGSPIALMIRNRDFANWQERMAPEGEPKGPAVTRPRPGHADLAGALKYGHQDVRNVLERASARETATRVALGAVARQLLEAVGIRVMSHVVALGGIRAREVDEPWDGFVERVEASPLRTGDPEAEAAMIQRIDEAKSRGDTLGGTFEVRVQGLPVGLGSYVQMDRRLDGRLTGALASIPAIKAVEVGSGFAAGDTEGSRVHDEIFWSEERGFHRQTNRAGGIEGGMTNGEMLVVRAVMKPIPTLYRPLRSVDLLTHEPFEASVERSDSTAVPAAAVVGEAMVALVLGDALLEKFGADSLGELKRGMDQWLC